MQEKAGREEARKQRLKVKQAAERASAKVGGVAQR